MKYFTLLAIALFFFTSPVFAGGGRIMVRINGFSSVPVNEPIYLDTSVYVAGSGLDQASRDERAEYRVRDPRDGDRCTTDSEKTNFG
ncbi:hypothetical protein HGB07_01280, partial [Candidatus Roizmanbacteria bacterium]|nr:hypothetical protein [Candidatus Roizmanbacteria bacterium]